MTRVVAIVDDLMDRSRITAAVPGAIAARGVDEATDADVVVVDLGGHAGDVAALRSAAPDALLVAFGRHDDVATLQAAREAGADRVLARSKFFADVSAAVEPTERPPTDRPPTERPPTERPPTDR